MKTRYMITFLANLPHRASLKGGARVSMNFRME